jgi:drug/metabolite transporter (DMT)-like permease
VSLPATDNFRAALLMIATMAGFALEDLFIKAASARVPMGQILFVLGAGGLVAMFAVARVRGVRLLDRRLLAPPVVVRNVAEMFTQIFGFGALALLPLSVVTSIGQSAPIVTTLVAALFLGETVGWRRWSAIAVGLAGVLLILRPGSAAFEPAMILSFAAVLCVAARDLATRRVPAELSVWQLNFWGYVTTLPAALVLLLAADIPPVWPEPRDWALILAAMVCGVVFYATLTMALRMGESSVVVPFRYTRLVFVLILAAVFLGERPDAVMLLGTALVTGAGLYTLLREARTRRRAAAAMPSPDPLAPL